MKFYSFAPVFRSDARVLILGTMPSPKSIEQGFYYGHPKNRFWPVLSSLLDCPLPVSAQEKRTLLVNNNLALWDVLSSCDRENAADATIRDGAPNDLETVTKSCPGIRAVALNGSAAHRLYLRYNKHDPHLELLSLPSTSPANASCGMARLLSLWSVILRYL